MSTDDKNPLNTLHYIAILVVCLVCGLLIIVAIALMTKHFNKSPPPPPPPPQEKRIEEEQAAENEESSIEEVNELEQRYRKINQKLYDVGIMPRHPSENYIVEGRQAKRISKIINQYPKGTMIRNHVTVF